MGSSGSEQEMAPLHRAVRRCFDMNIRVVVVTGLEARKPVRSGQCNLEKRCAVIKRRIYSRSMPFELIKRWSTLELCFLPCAPVYCGKVI